MHIEEAVESTFFLIHGNPHNSQFFHGGGCQSGIDGWQKLFSKEFVFGIPEVDQGGFAAEIFGRDLTSIDGGTGELSEFLSNDRQSAERGGSFLPLFGGGEFFGECGVAEATFGQQSGTQFEILCGVGVQFAAAGGSEQQRRGAILLFRKAVSEFARPAGECFEPDRLSGSHEACSSVCEAGHVVDALGGGGGFRVPLAECLDI